MAHRTCYHLVLLLTAALTLSHAAACGPKGTSDADSGVNSNGDAQVQADVYDPSLFTDDDGDGYSEMQGDCDDTNPLVHPFAVEICDDGIDNDCNGFIDAQEPDMDGDGFGPCSGDCDDTNPDISPVAPEIPFDGIDNNCDGIIDDDIDGDGWTVADGDCDDYDPNVYPGAVEVCGDGIDNDCNGFIDDEEPDMDGDGYGPCGGDCDDANPDIGPHRPEIPGDGIDNNCDNLVDEDIDGDGWTTYNGDCDDNDPTRHPAAIEICDDGIDNNCNGIIDDDCLSPCELASLMRSSVGCVYYAIDTNPLQSGQYAIAVSNIDNSATANVLVQVKNSGVWSTVSGGSFTVAPMSLRAVPLAHRNVNGTTIYAGGAYRITSDLPVIAYQFNPLDGASSYLSDASLLLPKSSLDNYHLIPAWPYGQDIGGTWRPAHIQIIATEATTVTVTSPIASTAGGGGAPTLQPGVPATFSMAEGDFAQFTVAVQNQSFSGTYVESSAPVAVFSSNDCANVPLGSGNCCCEHLEEQIFGLQTWGTTYVASRVTQRLTEGAVWQILASQDNTVVTFNHNAQVTGLPTSVTLNARQIVEYTVNGPAGNPGDFLVTATKPVLVVQYMVGIYTLGSTLGDPSMVQAVPVEQFLSQYVVLVPTTWQQDYFVLTREQGQTVSIDGSLVTTGWVSVGTSGYEVTRVLVPDGVHQVTGSRPFGIIVVGYDEWDSYAYPGGLNQQLINPIN